MATTSTLKSDNFESQLVKIKNDIETLFRELIDCLRDRERELLVKLEEIGDNYIKNTLMPTESLIELDKILKFNQENLLAAELKDTQTILVEAIKKKQEEMQGVYCSKRILFQFDSKLLENIKYFGDITVASSSYTNQPVGKYQQKVRPVVSIGDVAGSGVGQFNHPWGVEVDNNSETGNIYVADQSNNRVVVFGENLNYLFDLKELSSPLCIAVSQEKVFVTENGPVCLSVFDKNGLLLRRFGTRGCGDGQFKGPRGIAINEYNGDIFVCDYSNKRIQIFSQDYSYKSQFGNSIINCPSDIQITSDNIYVLSHQNPFLFIFNHNFYHLQTLKCLSLSKHLRHPFAFKIDGAGNFIISDYGHNSIFIFDNNLKLFHKCKNGISQPYGVSIDSQGRLLVVGYNHRLLTF